MYTFLATPSRRAEKRIVWAATRSIMESMGFVQKRRGRKSKSNWTLFLRLLKIFAYLLKITGYYRKGYGNAKAIKVTTLTLSYPNLPSAFDGFTILHLSDLHIDCMPGFAALMTKRIRNLRFDLCLLTGDYRHDVSGSFYSILKPMKVLSKFIQAPYGTFGVLGNHDTYLMAEYEKESGIELLINESVEIIKNGEKILLTGTDDPFDYYSEPALICLETSGYPFKIAIVHTPELSKAASRNGYDLYLCGHTHGGQICLREGKPIISHQFEGKEYNQGRWQVGKMVGYTSRGVGVSGIPVRFNCPPEMILITLQKG